MKSNKSISTHFLLAVLTYGFLGGLLVLFTTSLPIKGYWSILTYVFVVLFSKFLFKLMNQMGSKFITSFFLGFSVFIIMSYTQILYITFFSFPVRTESIELHLIRFLAVIGFAVLSGFVLGISNKFKIIKTN